ncbi:hypothetical protein LB507_008447 [Fusarium sp. FIESC RH6]|nr:hypothetical protein LB507_008447 [Fusarium sp. FIESC RH6]
MKKVFSLTALASSAVAFRDGWGFAGPPGDFSTTEWQARFEDANATGTYYFDAYNVSESFPPNKTVSGWSATIRVANITDDPEEGSVPYPGTDISIKAPDGMEMPESNSTEWQACMAVWTPGILTSGATSDAQHDDGDCSSFLSDECIDAIKALAAGFYFDGERCTTVPFIPEVCKKWYGEPGDIPGGTISGNFSSIFNGSTIFSGRPLLVGDSERVQTEEEAYNEAIRSVYTVMINWGRRSSFAWSSDDILQPTLLCLRTRNMTEGSEDPNTGTRAAVNAPMALVMSMLAAVLLVY